MAKEGELAALNYEPNWLSNTNYQPLNHRQTYNKNGLIRFFLDLSLSVCVCVCVCKEKKDINLRRDMQRVRGRG